MMAKLIRSLNFKRNVNYFTEGNPERTWPHVLNTIGIGKINRLGEGMLFPLTSPTQATGTAPTKGALSPDDLFYYNVNTTTPNISQFSRDAVTGLLTPLTPPTVAIGSGPFDVKISKGGKFLYSTDYSASTLRQFSRNITTGLLTPLSPATVSTTTGCYEIAISPDDNYLYCANFSGNCINQFLINTTTGLLTPLSAATVATGAGAYSIAITTDGLFVYSTNYSAATISQFSRDISTGLLSPLTPATIATGTSPASIKISTDGLFAYNTNLVGNVIRQFSRDVVTGLLSPLTPATVTTGVAARQIILSPDGKFAYTANSTSNTISQYSRDSVTGLLSPLTPATVTTGLIPYDIDISRDRNFAYVVNNGANAISLYKIGKSISTSITVPYVLGMTESEATLMLIASSLVKGSVTGLSGNVTSQNPIAGSSVVSGSSVNLTMQSTIVPYLVGLNQAAAIISLNTNFLKAGTITNINEPIISQSPVASTIVATNSSVNITLSATFTPLSINPEAWYNMNDITSLFQDTAGATPVTASGQAIGLIKDQTANAINLTQPTASLKPQYKTANTIIGLASAICSVLWHDLVDDAMIWNGTTGTRYLAVNTLSGVQFYMVPPLTNGQGFPVNQFIDCVVRLTNYTTQERADLNAYFLSKRPNVPIKDFSFICRQTPYVGRPYQIATGTVQQAFGGGTTYTSLFSGNQTVSPLELMTIDFNPDSGLGYLNVSQNNLSGTLPFFRDFTFTGMTTLHAAGNKLTGCIDDLPAACVELYLSDNLLTGVIPFIPSTLTGFYVNNNHLQGDLPTFPTNLQSIVIYNNQFRNAITVLPVACIEFVGGQNQFTGSIPALTPIDLVTFEANDNQLTGFTGGINSKINRIMVQNNLLTQATVDALLAACVTAGTLSGEINVGGTGNAAASSAGLASKATLISRGWTVTNN
jgi:6-phosphogluconolactonase (cycloisomerase 2 family)